MLGSTECFNQAIILIMFLDNILVSLTLQYLFSLWIWDLTVLFLFCFCFPYYFNQILKYFNKCNLFIAICTYLSTTDNPSSISLLLEPFLVYWQLHWEKSAYTFTNKNIQLSINTDKTTFPCTTSKLSVFVVILVRIFLAFSGIRTEYGRDMYLSVFSPIAGKCVKNADQNNSEYGQFLRSAEC